MGQFFAHEQSGQMPHPKGWRTPYWKIHAAVTKILAVLREAGFRRITISMSRSSAVRIFLSSSITYSTAAILLAPESGIHNRPRASRAMLRTSELAAGIG